MRDWIKWNGVDSTTKGIYVITQPAPQSPKMRGTEQTVPGRDGTLFITNGKFEPLVMEAECLVPNEADMWAALAWLSGEGTLEIATRPGGHWNALARTGFSATRMIKGRAMHTFTVQFSCDPYWLPEDGQDWNSATATGGSAVKNITLPAGSLESPAIWRITDSIQSPSLIDPNDYDYVFSVAHEGGDTATVSVDLRSVISDLGLLGTFNVYVDCDRKDVFAVYRPAGALVDAEMNLNPFTTLTDDEWPTLRAGANACSCSGGMMTEMAVMTNRRVI